MKNYIIAIKFEGLTFCSAKVQAENKAAASKMFMEQLQAIAKRINYGAVDIRDFIISEDK